ncbi:hypothetical protein L6274_04280 [Candidatus Parcubacteria bacterium]|nr:hypothetical protein [Candidatus Parcubacteria bacterium]MCG2809811.1 hypothetical protein [Candidatus Portnoybacteria bacterium]
MRNDKHLAVKLRKKGLSYNKISKELGIPKSTMHYWFKDLKWSKVIKKDLTEKAKIQSTRRLRAVIKAQRKRWGDRRKKFREDAIKEFPILKSNPLFLANLMLYWAEGDSNVRSSCTRLSNTDPKMIRIFSNFLRYVCSIPRERIRVMMILYPDLDEKTCMKFWSRASCVPKNQFYKTQFIYGRHPTRRLSYGVCLISVTGGELREKVSVWTDLYQKELKNMRE